MSLLLHPSLDIFLRTPVWATGSSFQFTYYSAPQGPFLVHFQSSLSQHFHEGDHSWYEQSQKTSNLRYCLNWWNLPPDICSGLTVPVWRMPENRWALSFPSLLGLWPCPLTLPEITGLPLHSHLFAVLSVVCLALDTLLVAIRKPALGGASCYVMRTKAALWRNWGLLPRATFNLQTCEWATSEADPLVPSRLSDDCGPGRHLHCSFMRDWEPEPTS